MPNITNKTTIQKNIFKGELVISLIAIDNLPPHLIAE
jgi:hypothetical protein